MAYSFNRVILVGRLTRDPEIRMTTTGEKIANFDIAVDRGYGDNKTVDFIKIVAFNKRAEFAENYLKKGLLILIEGSLRINKWKDNNGNNRERAEIWANTLQFMESKKQQNVEIIEPEEPFGNIDEKVDLNSDDIPQFYPID
ncbi:single-stranded DNA-binding protein [Marinitoga sp. 1197]|uniref:single-stranded DNA-binding protein n=1 Tax=Marinitoga sp. 1197 TaxID=1428449 RepID=UPI0006413694|nr:single-stranded DNA-binding protein [Marinitoga sp. 1197]AJW76893.1 single-stranded DNA-binding protein [Marinitoga camini virus 1]KLO24000.1 single-stranded DNA-binding protein [Marinitoga sp. 1197]